MTWFHDACKGICNGPIPDAIDIAASDVLSFDKLVYAYLMDLGKTAVAKSYINGTDMYKNDICAPLFLNIQDRIEKYNKNLFGLWIMPGDETDSPRMVERFIDPFSISLRFDPMREHGHKPSDFC